MLAVSVSNVHLQTSADTVVTDVLWQPLKQLLIVLLYFTVQAALYWQNDAG